jgi:hypothetical protein
MRTTAPRMGPGRLEKQMGGEAAFPRIGPGIFRNKRFLQLARHVLRLPSAVPAGTNGRAVNPTGG